MSLQFEDKTYVLPTYTEDEHPLSIFLKSMFNNRFLKASFKGPHKSFSKMFQILRDQKTLYTWLIP